MLWIQRTSVVVSCLAYPRSQRPCGTSQNVGPFAFANSAAQTKLGVSVGVMLLLESSDVVNSGRHLEVQFWLRSSVGRATPICAVALQRIKNHETETVDQHNINASSLFVAFARSFGTAQIIHDRGHAPERHMNSVVFVPRWRTNNMVSQRVHCERLDVKPQRANRTMILFGRR